MNDTIKVICENGFGELEVPMGTPLLEVAERLTPGLHPFLAAFVNNRMEVDSVVKLLFSGKRVFPIPIKRIDFHPAQRIAYAKVTLYPYVLAGVGG